MAIKVEITVERIPIVMDILPPYHIIEKISLPSVSVPKGILAGLAAVIYEVKISGIFRHYEFAEKASQ